MLLYSHMHISLNIPAPPGTGTSVSYFQNISQGRTKSAKEEVKRNKMALWLMYLMFDARPI